MGALGARTAGSARVHVGEVVVILGGALLLAGSWFYVVGQDHVPVWEEELFEVVNGLTDLLWPLVRVPMQLGGFLGSLIVVALVGLISRNKRLTLAALVASQVAFWSAKWVKGLVGRGRPSEFIPDLHLREGADGLGYVSGHTAVAFALAAVLVPSLPRRWQVVAWVLAAAVGFARIYAGVHLPLDVIGGAGMGLLIGTLSRWMFGLGGEGLPVTDGEAEEEAVAG